MEEKSITKSPRLYTELALKEGSSLVLEDAQAHYLKNVLRKNEGDPLRLFNGKDGEWVATIEALSKKEVSATLIRQLREQPKLARRIHLYFAPIKKHRMDFLIKKAVELGATDIHPVITQNTEVRKLNDERTRAQIIEAAEQCERLDIPAYHSMTDMFQALKKSEIQILAALERGNHPELKTLAQHSHQDIAILIGPEGGFTKEETQSLCQIKALVPVSLGQTILRAETAVLKMLSLLT